MATTARPEIDAGDIIARIMREMEEVISLIHRPAGRDGSADPAAAPPAPDAPDAAEDGTAPGSRAGAA